MLDTVVTRQMETTATSSYQPPPAPAAERLRFCRQRQRMATSRHQWPVVLCKVAVGSVLARNEQPCPSAEPGDLTHHDGGAPLAGRAHPTRPTPVAIDCGLYCEFDFTVDVAGLDDAYAVDAEHDSVGWASLHMHLELSFSQS